MTGSRGRRHATRKVFAQIAPSSALTPTEAAVEQQSNAAVEARATLHQSLGRLAQKIRKCESARRGDILLRLGGTAAGNYCLECGYTEVRVAESAAAGADRKPLIEVMGDAEIVRAVIDGEKDAREQFLAGGIRIRGDLQYFSDIALELGVLKAPL